MKILARGSSKENKWIGQCNHCNAIVTAKKEELTKIGGGDYRNDGEYFSWEDCPECDYVKSICFHEVGTKSADEVLKKLNFKEI